MTALGLRMQNIFKILILRDSSDVYKKDFNNLSKKCFNNNYIEKEVYPNRTVKIDRPCEKKKNSRKQRALGKLLKKGVDIEQVKKIFVKNFKQKFLVPT
jgi:hypothetical protein